VTNNAELLSLVKDLAVVHGTVTLSSGREADYYVDLRRVTLSGRAAPLVGRAMLELTADFDFDAVGGLTMGADPVATAMLHAAAASGRPLDAFVVRKEAKAHGMQRRIEGPDIAGRRVLVLEDTSTTGGSPLAALQALPPRSGGHPPYLEVRVRLDAPEPGLRARIEAALEGRHARLARIDTSLPQRAGADEEADALSLDQLDSLRPDELFRRLYRQKFDCDAPAEQLAAFTELMTAAGFGPAA